MLAILRSFILMAAMIVCTDARARTRGASPKLCDVRAFGARGDGKTVDTKAIQRAIDVCRGGGTLYFAPGRYVSGTLVLASHLTVKLEGGATLAGSRNLADYRPGIDVGLGRTLGVNVVGEGTLAGLLVARDAEDVTIEGPGTIDGEGMSFMENKPHVAPDFDPAATRNPEGSERMMHDLSYGPLEPKNGKDRPGVLVLFFRCRDVTVKDVTLTNSPNWTLTLQSVQRANLTGLHVVNSPLIPNNDGIDCNACRDAHIGNSDIHTGDDDLAISESEDVVVDNLTLSSRSAAVRLESTRRAVFSNLTIDSNRGLAVFASHDLTRPTDGVIFTNVVMRTHLIPGHWWGKGEPIYIAVQPCGATRACLGGVHNLTFSNIEAQSEAGAILAGTPGLPLSGVALNQVRLRIASPDPAIAFAIGGNFDMRWTAPTPATGIVRHDIPAIHVDHVDGLALRDVEVDWVGPQPVYATEAVNASHFADLTIQGLYEHGTAPHREAALAFSDGDKLLIQNVRVAAARMAIRLVRVANVQTTVPAFP